MLQIKAEDKSVVNQFSSSFVLIWWGQCSQINDITKYELYFKPSWASQSRQRPCFIIQEKHFVWIVKMLMVSFLLKCVWARGCAWINTDALCWFGPRRRTFFCPWLKFWTSLWSVSDWSRVIGRLQLMGGVIDLMTASAWSTAALLLL